MISFFVFIFGLCIGSFINCLVWRLYNDESLMNRSCCPACRQQIAWYDNVPVLSFMFLLGKCRHCRKPISWQYPIVELVVGLLFLSAFILESKTFATFDIFSLALSKSGLMLKLARDWFAISVMTVVFLMDFRWMIILDVVTLPSAVVIFILNLFLGASWQNMLISGIIGAGFFLLQYVVSKGKWIGGGDIRLGLVMGLLLGWPQVLAAILLSYIIGSFFSIFLLIAKKKDLASEIPLGTFLALGTIIMLFWGEQIVARYLSIY